MTAVQNPIFNKLAYVQALKSAHVTEEQAIAHADALETAMLQGVATPSALDKGLAGLKGDLDKGLAALNGDLDKGLAALKGDLDRGLAGMQSNLDKVAHELRAEFRVETARLEGTLIKWLVTTQLALGALVFAAIKLAK